MSDKDVSRRSLIKAGLATAAVGPWVLRHSGIV